MQMKSKLMGDNSIGTGNNGGNKLNLTDQCNELNEKKHDITVWDHRRENTFTLKHSLMTALIPDDSK